MPDLKEEIAKIKENKRSKDITKYFKDYFSQFNLMKFVDEFYKITIAQDIQQTNLDVVRNKLERCF